MKIERTDDGMTILSVWVIFERPRDYPTKYVLREQRVRNDGKIAMAVHADVADSPEPLRAKCEAMGLTCLTRAEADEPQILETWL